jgi:2-polyprenyl-3-methyl-5-hydroxy-6-metoxy-1,4-benzoquinol methylase
MQRDTKRYRLSATLTRLATNKAVLMVDMTETDEALNDRFVDRFYDGYMAFKSDWTGRLSDEAAAYFSALPPLACLAPNAELLEIGFGDGQLLTWAQQRGVKVVGSEIQPELLRRAEALGFDVVPGPLGPGALSGRLFDCVVAFDVFEHLTVKEIHETLLLLRDHLKADGFILLRFPNSASPLGAFLQNSDVTHKTSLSAAIMAQIGHDAGFELREIRVQPYPTKFTAKVRRFLVYRLRDFIEHVVGVAYFGGGRVYLDPNVIISLRRIEA